MQRLQSFLIADNAAVTVDWVVLAAATVGLGIAIYPVIQPNTADLITTASTAVEGETTAFTTSIEDYVSQ